MSGPRTTTVPVLPVADVIRSTAWYQRLGFELRAEYDGYAILALDDAELHLVELDPTMAGGQSASGAYLRVADVDAVHAHWAAVGARIIAEPEDQFYGIREFATEDLDGNLWRVGSPVGGVEPDAAFDGSTTEPVPSDAPRPPAPSEPEPVAAQAAADDARTDGGPGTVEEAWYPLVADGQRCAGCGLPNGELAARAIGAQVRDEVHSFGDLLAAADDDDVRRRPAPGSWSALEHGVHTRDALAVFAERVIRTLAEHQPELGWWDHEADIADGMANESDVGAVVDDLGRNAAKLSEALRLVTDDDWERSATRRGRERFTIELLARFALHEVVHHRWDARRALDAAAGG
ncbi:DinB family protein [Aquihabitans sp. McL0605]|uniref:DinB family protein n=1 Tax=Aquihabitans sp. McL0605 TaxID=3415671 RepID=UPI003CF4A89D